MKRRSTQVLVHSALRPRHHLVRCGGIPFAVADPESVDRPSDAPIFLISPPCARTIQYHADDSGGRSNQSFHSFYSASHMAQRTLAFWDCGVYFFFFWPSFGLRDWAGLGAVVSMRWLGGLDMS